jgi:penicillin-binding protein 1A
MKVVNKNNNKLAPQDIKRYNRTIWKVVIGGFFIVILLFFAVGLGLFGALPSFRDLENPKSNQASEVIGDDGHSVLGTYYIQNRSSVTYKELSPNLVNALVATEDNRFYKHSGIDFSRTFTMVLYNLVGKQQGGSTITQQLALNLFSERSHNKLKRSIQKLQEWITAVKIERHYTKEEIITMYFNTVPFGAYNTFGIKSAARTYFNTTPDKLTPDQAAVLVAMVNGPSLYSPIRHADRALTRRNFVLGRMAAEGYLSEDQAHLFQQKPLGLNFHRIDHNEGIAPYFRATIRTEIQRKIKELNLVKSDGTAYDIDRDGLKIYTTINPTMQQYAEEAQSTYMRNLQAQFNEHWKGYKLSKVIKNYQYLIDQGMMRSDRYKLLKTIQGKSDEEIQEDFNTPTELELFTWKGKIDTMMKPIDSIVYNKMLLRNAVMSMDPTTGYIKAWIGGINFEHFKYDQVRQGSRQVGSTAKPFTYSVAIENGFSPCMQINNVPDTIRIPGSPPWCPASSPSETIPGMITLRTALAHSQNWVTASVMKVVGAEPVMQLIKKSGVNTYVPPYPSICLGVFNATVFDMTGAYGIFANQGLWTEPTYLLRIEDKNGTVLYSQQPRVVQVLNPQTAYVMTYMLKGVIEDGTGSRLRGKYGLTNPIGGKTGTTNDNSDGWFIGITPQLVTGVWTGCEDRDIHFRSTRLGEGANTALPIFAMYMQKVYANPALGIKKNVDFVKPPNGVDIVTDCSVYNQQQQGSTAPPDKKLGF